MDNAATFKRLLEERNHLHRLVSYLDSVVEPLGMILGMKKSRISASKQDYAQKLQIVEAIRHILQTVNSSDLSEPEKSILFKGKV